LGEAAGVVGRHLTNSVFDEEQLIDFVQVLLSDEVESSRRTMDSCLYGLLGRLELPKREQLLSRTLSKLKDHARCAEKTLRLLLNAPFDGATWAFVDSLSETERRLYWTSVAPYWCSQTPDEVNRIVDEFLGVERPRVAFRAVEMELRKLESERLIRLLFEVATNQSEPEGYVRLAPHHISKAFEVLTSRAGYPGMNLPAWNSSISAPLITRGMASEIWSSG